MDEDKPRWVGLRVWIIASGGKTRYGVVRSVLHGSVVVERDGGVHSVLPLTERGAHWDFVTAQRRETEGREEAPLSSQTGCAPEVNREHA
jgi:hypothetical protein